MSMTPPDMVSITLTYSEARLVRQAIENVCGITSEILKKKQRRSDHETARSIRDCLVRACQELDIGIAAAEANNAQGGESHP